MSPPPSPRPNPSPPSSPSPSAPPPTPTGPAPPPWTCPPARAPPHEPQRGPRPRQRDYASPAARPTMEGPTARSRPATTRQGPCAPQLRLPRERVHPRHRLHCRSRPPLNRRETNNPAIEGWRLCRAPHFSFFFSLCSICCSTFCFICFGGGRQSTSGADI